MDKKIITTKLHPHDNENIILYPETSAEQIPDLESWVRAHFTDEKGIKDITAGTPYIAGDNTVTPITVTLTDETTKEFSVVAKNGVNGVDGAAGRDGNGIVSIHTLSHSVVGDETVNNVEVIYTEEESQTFEVHCANGANGSNGKIALVYRNIVEQPPTPNPPALGFTFSASVSKYNRVPVFGDVYNVTVKVGDTDVYTCTATVVSVDNDLVVSRSIIDCVKISASIPELYKHQIQIRKSSDTLAYGIRLTILNNSNSPISTIAGLGSQIKGNSFPCSGVISSIDKKLALNLSYKFSRLNVLPFDTSMNDLADEILLTDSDYFLNDYVEKLI